MTMTTNAIGISLLTCSLAALLSGQAIAQDGATKFRLEPAKGNPGSCVGADAALSRVHTVTFTGDKAVIKSSGGVDDNLKQTAPKVYKTDFTLGGIKLNVVADGSVTPMTLVATEPKLGCRWNGVAQ